jgi:general secretion pathway protein A
MYKTFFNLQRNPFEITPDPAFMFPTQRHNEALAALYYGVQRRKGFIVMTGEVGTGKTLVVRCLLELLNRQSVAYAYVFNSRLAPDEFLRYVAGDLGIPAKGKSKGELLLDLSTYLVSRYQRKLTTVLVVDEAHHLASEVLEEVRLLTNLETADQKLLQILLIGQPELDHKLDSIELRQLKQRIAWRSHLDPLTREETAGYIHRRMRIAGANSHAGSIFPAETVATIYRHARGIPRLINTVCENALISAYAKQSHTVTPAMVEEAAHDLRLGIVSMGADDENRSNDEALRRAMRTLLDFSEALHAAKSQQKETIKMRVVARTDPDE